MARIIIILEIVAGLLVFLLFGGLFITSSTSMPRNAVLLLDDQKKAYIAPPCVNDPSGLRIGNVAEARDLGYKPERECREEGGFVQQGRSLTGSLLERIGVLKPLKKRWNEDGSWNY